MAQGSKGATKKGQTGRTRAEEMKVLEMRAEIATLYKRGWNQYELAEKFGLSQPAIWSHIRKMKDKWLEEQAAGIEEIQALQIERILDVMRVAWEAFEKSKGRRVRTTSVREPKDSKDSKMPTKVTRHAEEMNGDPRYLDKVMWAIEKINQMYQLDKPKGEGARGVADLLSKHFNEIPPAFYDNDTLREYAAKNAN